MTSVFNDTRLGKKPGLRYYAKQHGGPNSAIYIYDGLRDAAKPKQYFAKHEDIDAGFNLLHALNKTCDLKAELNSMKLAYRDAKYSAELETKQRRTIQEANLSAFISIEGLSDDNDMLSEDVDNLTDKLDVSERHNAELQEEVTRLTRKLESHYACCGPDPDILTVSVAAYEGMRRDCAQLEAQNKALLESVAASLAYHPETIIVDPFGEERDKLNKRIGELIGQVNRLHESLHATALSDRENEKQLKAVTKKWRELDKSNRINRNATADAEDILRRTQAVNRRLRNKLQQVQQAAQLLEGDEI